jgi:hypothetical protein
VKTVDCCREDDVLDALTSSRWPDRVDDDIKGHVATCAICADVVAVASAVLEVRNDEPGEMRIPSSAVMWWRAQMRARQEAAREAARPITVAQVVAAVTLVAVAVSALIALSPWVAGVLGGWMPDVEITTGLVALGLAALGAPSGVLTQGWVLSAVVVGLGVWLVLAPVAIYFAVADD